MMTIVEMLAVQNPMKWSALENPIQVSQVYIQYASRWVGMSEIERLLDEDTPEEFEYLFSHSEDKDIVQTVIDIWSTLN
jgi:hypothetical protein